MQQRSFSDTPSLQYSALGLKTKLVNFGNCQVFDGSPGRPLTKTMAFCQKCQNRDLPDFGYFWPKIANFSVLGDNFIDLRHLQSIIFIDIAS